MKSSHSTKLVLPTSFALLLLSPHYIQCHTSQSLCLSLCFYGVFLSCLHSDSLNKSVHLISDHDLLSNDSRGAGMGRISKRTNKEAFGKWKVRTRHQRFFIYDFKAHNTIVQFLSSFSFDPSSLLHPLSFSVATKKIQKTLSHLHMGQNSVKLVGVLA